MDFQIRITEAALADFEEILEYSFANFPATAERFGNSILDHLDLLQTFPYYRVHEAAGLIEVLHFWHSARRPPKF